MYAVLSTGGKQFRLFEGDVFRAERIEAPVGDTVELENVRLLVTDDGVVADPAKLSSAKVVCEVRAQDRSKKIRVFKKKRRKGYARTQGHRQSYTELVVKSIQA